jgi:muramoyltetrapeptide carboxypeptidase LdcA involved in peptidoglycan recycling
MIDNAAAVVLGDFTDCGVTDKTDKIWPVIQRFADSLKIPMLRGIQTGHAPIQRALPFGTPSVLTLGDGAKLVCTTGVATK